MVSTETTSVIAIVVSAVTASVVVSFAFAVLLCAFADSVTVISAVTTVGVFGVYGVDLYVPILFSFPDSVRLHWDDDCARPKPKCWRW